MPRRGQLELSKEREWHFDFDITVSSIYIRFITYYVTNAGNSILNTFSEEIAERGSLESKQAFQYEQVPPSDDQQAFNRDTDELDARSP